MKNSNTLTHSSTNIANIVQNMPKIVVFALLAMLLSIVIPKIASANNHCTNNCYGNGNNNSSYIRLSQSTVNIGTNRTATVSISGSNGYYYISNNTNSGVATAVIENSLLKITSNTIGTATITVCTYNNYDCATVYVNVQGTSYNQPVYLSQSTLNLNVGKGQAVSIYGGGSYTISTNSNPTVISSLIQGDVLNVYGSAPGTGTLTICSAASYSGGCTKLQVTVAGGYYRGSYNNVSYYNGGYYYTQPSVTAPNYYNPTISSNSYYASRASQVYLNQLPVTGVGLGMKVILFIIGLVLWALFISYVYLSKTNRKLSFADVRINQFKMRNKMR